MRRSPLSAAVLATAMFALASCADQPLSPEVASADVAQTASFDRGGVKPSRGTVSGAINVIDDGINLVGTAYLTKIELVDGQLMGTSRIVGTATNTLTGASVPVDIVQRTTLSINGTTGLAASASDAISTQQISTQQAGSACDILDLVLGPLHLDLLGLVVDLNQVVLNIDAQPGGGNLLGNLLCAVVHLLDGPGAIAGILNLLDRINGILDLVNNILP